MPTVIITVVVTLLFDWWVKPRLEVRNELFKMRAQDRIDLIRTLNSLLISCGQMSTPDHENEQIQGLLKDRAEALRQNLPQEAQGMQMALVALGDRLSPTMREMLSKSYGYILGACMSGQPPKVVAQSVVVPVALLLDAVRAQKFTVNHWYQQRRLRRWLDHNFADYRSKRNTFRLPSP